VQDVGQESRKEDAQVVVVDHEFQKQQLHRLNLKKLFFRNEMGAVYNTIARRRRSLTATCILTGCILINRLRLNPLHTLRFDKAIERVRHGTYRKSKEVRISTSSFIIFITLCLCFSAYSVSASHRNCKQTCGNDCYPLTVQQCKSDKDDPRNPFKSHAQNHCQNSFDCQCRWHCKCCIFRCLFLTIYDGLTLAVARLQ